MMATSTMSRNPSSTGRAHAASHGAEARPAPGDVYVLAHGATPPASAPRPASPYRTEAERAARRQQQRRRQRLYKIAAPALVVLLVLAWQLGATAAGLSEFILPTPFATIKRIAAEWPMFMRHAWITGLEVVLGFAMAAMLGILMALLIFYSKLFERAVYPILAGLQTVPKVALAPLLVLYLGYGWGPKLFLAGFLAFFPIVVSTVLGLKGVDPGLVNAVRSMGATPRQIFFRVRLPAALPNIFGGFKVGMSLAVIGAVIGEYVAAEKGLGYLQLQANANFDTTLNLASVFIIAIMGSLLYCLLALVESRFVFSRNTQR
ncbi:MAG: ABC transporter permease [Pigmentiphaga sp.]|uniref:ABC transporter permease n=1 Tax=Pigmentiphaga sp. TaxID=1977564 RepID=UPI0029ABD039|nr:ABC transporter permease [Pigmentiphaga sp.]MDX3906123.1 ABC transporter permease [Pigmentiphaga sp.]